MTASCPEDATDFNDLALYRGTEAVTRAISSARAPERIKRQPVRQSAPAGDPAGQDWPEPLPLVAKVSRDPYPLDALPAAIRAAVGEVQEFTKAPIPVVAASALSTLSLAIQAYADVQRADKLQGPTSCYLLTIADSGERKSTCDSIFMKAIDSYEAQAAKSAIPLIKDHRAAVEIWEAKRSGIKDHIRQLAKEGKSIMNIEATLRDLEHNKPVPPRVPRLLYADATPEALAFGLAMNWPSGGVVSAEAGIVFGAHGMGKDSVMRNLALLNTLWEGGRITIDRRTSESFTLRGARLTIALQVQEATLRCFLDQSGTLARGIGFLSRFLVAWPESTQGSRLFTNPPSNWPALETFNRRIFEILNTETKLDDEGTLAPDVLTLSPEAKTAWRTFHDEIEAELRMGGELYDVRDVASKAADNIARLAALFHVFSNISSSSISKPISAGDVKAAGRIVAWHLNESRRFFVEFSLPMELAKEARLDTWLLDYCRREQTHIVPMAKVQQFGPCGLRKRVVIDATMRELYALGRARLVRTGRRQEIHVNPALLN